MRYFFLLVLCSMFFSTVVAQKSPQVFYLKKSGVPVEKEKADYILAIFPPDTSIDKHLFRVKEYYLNGKIRLMTASQTDNINLKFQGSCITFFPDGQRMRISNYENGDPVGDEIEYYPNGKLYDIKTYAGGGKIFLKQCNDSTGKVLAENGKGKWISFFDDSFGKAYAEGGIIDSLQNGEWHGRFNDSVSLKCTYQKGQLISSAANDKTGKEHVFKPDEIISEVRGSFGGNLIFKSWSFPVHYPDLARENGIQGTVWVNFINEKDGTKSNIKVKQGIGYGCDGEAVRAIKMFPNSVPAHLYGIPVRVALSFPISFTLVY